MFSKIFSSLSLLLLIVLQHPQHLSAQAPGWTDYVERTNQFPKDSYIVGFNSERNVSSSQADEVLENLLDYAKIQLIESISVTIKSIGTLNITNINSQTHEYFKKTSASYSKVNVTGLNTDIYYDKRKKEAFAIAYASRSELIDTYRDKIKKGSEVIKRKIEAANTFKINGDNQSAMKNYFETLPVFREVEEAYTIIVALNTGLIQEIEPAIQEINNQKFMVNQAVAELQKGDDLSLDDVAYFMAKGFQIQTNKPKRPIQLANFTYQDSKMGSPFSKRWGSVFEKKLVDAADYPIVKFQADNFYSGSNVFKTEEDNERKESLYRITGTYWEEGDDIKIIAILREIESGKALASMEGSLDVSWLLANNVQYRPENFEVAYENQKVFSKDEDEVVGGELMVDVWTNRGDENLIFTEGETMKVFVRVNKPSYLRFIYHLADGTKVMLLDNYFIDQENVNKVYEIPEEFECSAPFGVETMQINAQSKRFEPLNYNYQDGYQIITDDLEEVVSKTRGFKTKKKTSNAEKRVIITTIAAN
ncbi:DUF4384 domain-containing protein [Flexithrix dorotheae]|uniref:DUF4384 domain-containing protein n=1 Tax=Flexithrix dorotheae TaxID=70993 RepID=UPI000381DE99|nr:DUF4384 domain-containing protein [Flexithrix dorotheae]